MKFQRVTNLHTCKWLRIQNRNEWNWPACGCSTWRSWTRWQVRARQSSTHRPGHTTRPRTFRLLRQKIQMNFHVENEWNGGTVCLGGHVAVSDGGHGDQGPPQAERNRVEVVVRIGLDPFRVVHLPTRKFNFIRLGQTILQTIWRKWWNITIWWKLWKFFKFGGNGGIVKVFEFSGNGGIFSFSGNGGNAQIWWKWRNFRFRRKYSNSVEFSLFGGNGVVSEFCGYFRI